MDGFQFLLEIFKIVKDAPGWASVVILFVVAVFALYLRVRKVNLEEVTSVSKIQSDQVESLLKQLQVFSSELSAARQQISAMHEKIEELEVELRNYRMRCDTCPMAP